MKSKRVRVFVASMALVVVLGFVPVAAFAHGGDDHSHVAAEETTLESDSGESRREGLKTKLEDLKEERLENKTQRLEEAKLRACEQRKSRIQAIMNRGITRAERQIVLFSTIADRVKAFYEDKGYSLDNYDELVAAVDAAKAKAEANLEVLKGLDSFTCDAEDPKGNAEAFKLAIQTIRQDLKDYRSAVNDLIVGVKSAHSGEEGGEE